MMNAFLAAARAAAATEILRYYRGTIEVELKADHSPVTIADRRAEEIIKGMLLAEFPGHGMFSRHSPRRAQ